MAFYGAVPQITQKPNLQLLAGILPVEAYHAAILRTLLYNRGLDIVAPYRIRVFDFVQVRCWHQQLCFDSSSVLTCHMKRAHRAGRTAQAERREMMTRTSWQLRKACPPGYTA